MAKIKLYSDRAVTLAMKAKIALSALLSQASRGISRTIETERKRAGRFMATAPRPFKPFKLESLYPYIHRNIMPRRRPEAHTSRTDARYSFIARSEEVLAEPSMKRPAGVTIIAIATFVGAAILAVGSCIFFFVAIMAISGGDGGDPVSASIAGWEWQEVFRYSCWRESQGALRWGCCNCANGREFWRLAVSELEFCARWSAFLLLSDTP